MHTVNIHHPALSGPMLESLPLGVAAVVLQCDPNAVLSAYHNSVLVFGQADGECEAPDILRVLTARVRVHA